jgi:integrative and conjugative element protein (TIGR02256 family)
LGRYINDHKTLIIGNTLLPQKYKSSKYSFERGSEGLKELFEVYYNAMPSLIYVGEWHTHPDNSATPSQTDLKAMRELANDKNVLINNPVLMILGLRKSGCALNIYLLHNNKLLKYDEERE